MNFKKRFKRIHWPCSLSFLDSLFQSWWALDTKEPSPLVLKLDLNMLFKKRRWLGASVGVMWCVSSVKTCWKPRRCIINQLESRERFSRCSRGQEGDIPVKYRRGTQGMTSKPENCSFGFKKPLLQFINKCFIISFRFTLHKTITCQFFFTYFTFVPKNILFRCTTHKVRQWWQNSPS